MDEYAMQVLQNRFLLLHMDSKKKKKLKGFQLCRFHAVKYEISSESCTCAKQ